MHKRFVPKSYKEKLFVKLNSLQQNSLSVELYITEFEKLYLACGCCKEEEQKCAKFLLGLARHIRFACEMSSYETFDDLCLLAATVERQFNESKDSMVTASSSSKLHEDERTRTSSSPLAHVFKGKGEDVKDFTGAHQAIPMLSPESDDGDVIRYDGVVSRVRPGRADSQGEGRRRDYQSITTKYPSPVAQSNIALAARAKRIRVVISFVG
uniref:Retrotransposon gag domain-containing protein n=1 Tax=Chenopodium quinoa TaxID=63459 RepID=A0A803NCF2_CHEQI